MTEAAIEQAESDKRIQELVILYMTKHPGKLGKLADNLKVSHPTVRHWSEGRNLPLRGVAQACIRHMEKLLAE